MSKLLIAAAVLFITTAGTAVAKQEGIPNVYYMAIHLGTGKCVMMTSVPNPAKYKVMGAYKTPGAASTSVCPPARTFLPEPNRWASTFYAL